MKQFITPFLTVAVLAATPVLASDTVHTFTMPEKMKVSAFLNLEGPGYPLMEVSAFCVLNQEQMSECSADSWLEVGQPVSFQT